MNAREMKKDMNEEEAMEILKQLMALSISEPQLQSFLKFDNVELEKNSMEQQQTKGEDMEMGEVSDCSTAADLEKEKVFCEVFNAV